MPFLQAWGRGPQIGAVNTLVRTPEGWVGHNTDAWGFRRSIQPFLKNTHERALVLGTGGSAAAVIWALQDLGIDVVAVSSRPKLGRRTPCRRACDRLRRTQPCVDSAHLLVVHCTPVGMSPNTENMVAFPPPTWARDTSWWTWCIPPKTRLLREAQAQGGGAQRRRHAQVAGRQGLGNWSEAGFDLVASQYF